ncbi:hypothetical protein M8C21_029814 [Ambrosia artemisiifolia]|uniref:cyclin-dependent kinase n=1 Tax=Ambrosia artemisiifolia TaxID=4212 RepID=A0AAD5C0B8_AMBAR|nr:hypothetical protein M8C21_029814 [Ambrosia artemisiifolia]
MGDRYEFIGKLGEGGFGIVHKAIDKTTGKFVAVKFSKQNNNEQGIPARTLREIGILNMVSVSDFVVRLLAIEEINGRLGLVFEFLDTDLEKLINSVPLPPSKVKKYMFQLCKALFDIHGYGVLHRDLKPQNVLFDRDNDILKIADLGLGRSFTLPEHGFYTMQLGTSYYKAPEILLDSNDYYTGPDIWSLGCIFAEMSTGKKLFTRRCYSDVNSQLISIFSLLGTPTEEELPGLTSKLQSSHWQTKHLRYKCQDLAAVFPSLGADGVDLLSKMLTYNPAQRISAGAALEHPYFAELDT